MLDNGDKIVKPGNQDAGHSTLPSKEYENGARFRTLRSTIVENPLQIGPVFCKTKPISTTLK